MSSENKKGWREVYKVHPAADLFPMLPEDELKKLGEDIKANGLKEDIVLWKQGGLMDRDTYYLLDGRNRLDAMKLVGILKVGDKSLGSLRGDGTGTKCLHDGVDPYAYVISKNIRRRHLTKEQQADLIVKVMKAKEAGLAKMANPVKPRNEKGQLQGQKTKDPIKQATVEEGKKHGISKRTVERAIAKDKGPTQKTAREQEPPESPTDKSPADILRSVLNLDKQQAKPTRAQLENYIRSLAQKITDLQTELSQMKEKELTKQLENNFNSLRGGVEGWDWAKSCKSFMKKYHPDHNPHKAFTANEIIADFIPIWTRFPAWVKEEAEVKR